MGDERAYPLRPICGVGAVAFLNDAVLLVQRGRAPRRGEWSIPGGAVELGETVREAAAREFREECGGEIELRGVADVVDVITRDEAGRVEYHYVICDFWGEWQGGTLAAQSDALNVRWVGLNELDGIPLAASTRQVIYRANAARRGR